MCGRYTLAITYRELAEELGVAFDPAIEQAYRPRYNIAPTDGNLVLCEHEDALALVPARFGLVNFWAKDLSGAARQINARAETVRDKPAFREAFEHRRCIVPADGFYEWRKDGGKTKTPFWFHPTEGKLLRFAGLYETWKDKATGQRLRTFAIITTGANDLVGPIHDRMPAILAPEDARVWLSAAPDEAFALLRPAPEDALEAKRVSHHVGNVRNDDPSLLVADEPASAALPLFDRTR
jgi:putative SOS response-associated peptidase YedK